MFDEAEMSGPHDPNLEPAAAQAGSGRARLRGTVARLARSAEGVSAVEFGLLAPLLVFALLATVDVGLALTERMTINHVLRAGAQSATTAKDAAAIDRVMRTTAAPNFTVAAPGAAGDDASLALEVTLVCSCAEQPGAAVACSTTCAGSAPTQVFYTLEGEKTYSGLLLPRFRLSPAIRVQVR